eukprot:scaffold8624_cov30-Tisochrysis_lutea.AAC.1
MKRECAGAGGVSGGEKGWRLRPRAGGSLLSFLRNTAPLSYSVAVHYRAKLKPAFPPRPSVFEPLPRLSRNHTRMLFTLGSSNAGGSPVRRNSSYHERRSIHALIRVNSSSVRSAHALAADAIKTPITSDRLYFSSVCQVQWCKVEQVGAVKIRRCIRIGRQASADARCVGRKWEMRRCGGR